LKALDVLVGRHPHDDELASLVGLADRLDLHARRRLLERAVVLHDVGVVGQLVGGADVVAEDVLRRRNPFDDRQMVDERAALVPLAGPILDRLLELRVLRLLGIAGLGDHLLRRERRDGCEQGYADQELLHGAG
jgi:hypothetical protein